MKLCRGAEFASVDADPFDAQLAMASYASNCGMKIRFIGWQPGDMGDVHTITCQIFHKDQWVILTEGIIVELIQVRGLHEQTKLSIRDHDGDRISLPTSVR